MTGNTITLEIDGSQVDINNLTVDWTDDTSKIYSWSAVLSDISETVSTQDAIEIKRNGTSIFKGIVETIEPKYSMDDISKTVGGRHTKVKLWRKWNQRYESPDGFWGGYYPDEIIKFLLKRPTSDYPEAEKRLRIVGTGLDSEDFQGSGTSYEQTGSEETYHYNSAFNKLGANGWWLGDGSGQTTNDYFQVQLGDSSISDICGIIIKNSSLNTVEDRASFARNYKIETSTNGSDWTEVASKSDNEAVNIVHSWTPASAKYIKITITSTESGIDWRIGDLYVYQSRGSITGISEGTLSSHDPLNMSDLSSNVSSGSDVDIDVNDGTLFEYDDWCVLKDDNGEENVHISAVSGNTVTVDSVSGSYTTAANGKLINLKHLGGFNLKYDRITNSIEKIVKLLKNADGTTWEWEVTDDGAVNLSSSLGSDVSASVSFTYGTDMISSSKKEDDRKKVDTVLVLAGGKGWIQDRYSSGWQGSGDYEKIVVDKDIKRKQAAINRANEILTEEDDPEIVTVTVYDDYTTGDWEIFDTITLTNSYTGLSGTYKVKKLKRKWSSSGEIVSITAQDTSKSIPDVLKEIKDKSDPNDQQEDEIEDRLDLFARKDGYVYFIEAEYMTLDSDVTFVTGDSKFESNARYITMSSADSGSVFWGPGLELKAGTYTAKFRSQVSDNSSGSNLVTLSVYSQSYGGTVESLTIKPSTHNSSATWQTINIVFTLDDDYNDIEFVADSFQTGITNWFCDYIAVVAGGVEDYPPGAPDAPTNVAVSGKLAGLEIKWDKCTDYDFKEYILYRDTSSPATTEYARGKTNYFIDKNFSDYTTTIYYRVKAVDWAGNESAYSSEASAIPAQVIAGDLEDNSVTSNELAADAVGQEHVQDYAIGGSELINAAVNALKVADGAIIEDKLGDGAVTTNKIGLLAVIANRIANGAVGSDQIAANNITTNHLSANAVSANNLAANSVIAGKIAANAVVADSINAGAIIANKIDSNAVTADKILAGAISANKIESNAVTADKIFAGAVEANKIATDAVVADKIAANAVTSVKIDAGAIIANKIGSLAVTADKIAANAVTAAKIEANAVTADKINAGSITTNKVAASAITATEIDANAVTSNKIIAEAILSTKVAANAITANHVASDTIQTRHLTANSVVAGKIEANAVTANKVAAGSIDSNHLVANSVTTGIIAGQAVSIDKIDPNVGTGLIQFFFTKWKEYSSTFDHDYDNESSVGTNVYSRQLDGEADIAYRMKDGILAELKSNVASRQTFVDAYMKFGSAATLDPVIEYAGTMGADAAISGRFTLSDVGSGSIEAAKEADPDPRLRMAIYYDSSGATDRTVENGLVDVGSGSYAGWEMSSTDLNASDWSSYNWLVIGLLADENDITVRIQVEDGDGDYIYYDKALTADTPVTLCLNFDNDFTESGTFDNTNVSEFIISSQTDNITCEVYIGGLIVTDADAVYGIDSFDSTTYVEDTSNEFDVTGSENQAIYLDFYLGGSVLDGSSTVHYMKYPSSDIRGDHFTQDLTA